MPDLNALFCVLGQGRAGRAEPRDQSRELVSIGDSAHHANDRRRELARRRSSRSCWNLAIQLAKAGPLGRIGSPGTARPAEHVLTENIFPSRLTHSGMFPCFFAGSEARLVRSARSACVT